uniref:Outer dense fiber protein 2-like n=1 Tax=Phallusia mammillata TaxID=59560 RepID=A0A6F9DMY6_9ASCI|nr:outer dense fiber protein 2-like [Phallusia mammillata]
MSSPIHVHVQDNTPLHVHVKKPKKTEFKESQPARSSNARHSVRSGPRGKLKPINDPWIPAPGKTSIRDRLDKQYKWESTRSQLEVNAPQHLDLNLHPSDEIPMKASDLSTEEDSRLRAHLSEYERKIENLMSEVGTLKNEMELKKIEGELERKDEQLEASHAALEDKMKELNFIEQEFQETEKENMRLRKSVENYQDTMATSLKEVGNLPTDKDSLLHQLVEVEVNGTEAGKQVAALRDVASRLKYEKRLAISDVNLLSKQRDLLLQKLEQFEASNRKVRRLLQSQHKTISDVQRLEEQRDILMKKMADSDSEILKMRSELIQRRNDVEQLTAQVSEEKNHARTLNELNKSVEATRAHLQRELRAKEMENNRLHVQLKNMERDTEVARREAEEITAAARSEREMIAREKEGLKKATRSQRNRAEKAEDEMKRMEERLGDRERKLEEARSQADAWRDRYQRTADEKGRLDDHVQSLAQKASDLESVLRSNEIIAQTKEDEYRSKLDKLMSDNSGCRSDAERNKTDCALAEERSRQAQKEAANLRAEIRQRESVEADLRTQLRKAKNEAEEALLTAERVERNSRRMRDDGNNEIERVREQMLDRMRDLQPLPELLKETEMKLQDTQDKLHVFEQRSAEQTRIIAELTNKTEDRADETSSLRQRIVALNDENRALEARLQILQVKLDDRDVRVKETVLDTVGKDERIQQLQLKFEEANHEKVSFKRQLEAAVADSRKAVESEVEKAAAREHAAQARIIDLETTITRLKTDVASAKRSKEDSERRNQSKLQDAKDRLEQAESTNRSMRNYVNFLKTSYNNVFGGDASFTSTPVRGADRSPF